MRSTPDYLMIMRSRSLNFLSAGLYPVNFLKCFLQSPLPDSSSLLLLLLEDSLDDYFFFFQGLSFQMGFSFSASFFGFQAVSGLGAALMSLGLSLIFSASFLQIFSFFASTLLFYQTGLVLVLSLFQTTYLVFEGFPYFLAKMSTTLGMYLASFFSGALQTGLGVLAFKGLEVEVGLFTTGCILVEYCSLGLVGAQDVLFLLPEEMYQLISSSFLVFLISGSFFFGAGRSISKRELRMSGLDSFFSSLGGGGLLKSCEQRKSSDIDIQIDTILILMRKCIWQSLSCS